MSSVVDVVSYAAVPVGAVAGAGLLYLAAAAALWRLKWIPPEAEDSGPRGRSAAREPLGFWGVAAVYWRHVGEVPGQFGASPPGTGFGM